MTMWQRKTMKQLEEAVGVHEWWMSNYNLYVTTCTMNDYKITRDGAISEADWSRDR